MAEAKKKKTKPTDAQKAKIKAEAEKRQAELARKKEIRDEITSVIIIAIGVFFIVSLKTSSTGAVGEVVQNILYGLFGKIAIAFPFYMIVYGILNFAQKTSYITWRSVLFFAILFFLVSTLWATKFQILGSVTWNPIKAIYITGKSGPGAVGAIVYALLAQVVGKTGIYIICAAGIIISLMFVINTPISALFDKIKIKAKAKREATAAAMAAYEEEKTEQVKIDDIKKEIEQKAAVNEVHTIETHKESEEEKAPEEVPKQTMPLPKFSLFGKKEQHEEQKIPAAGEESEEPVYDEAENRNNIIKMMNDDSLLGRDDRSKTSGYGLEESHKSSDGPVSKGLDLSPMEPMGVNVVNAQMFPEDDYAVHKQGAKYKFPPLSLLNKAKTNGGKGSVANLGAQAQLLEDALNSFGVNASVVDYTQGPSVTRFEVEPAPGVKVSSISKLHDDIMLHLRAKSLRIEAPIPGKAAVGIEVSNDTINMVSLREILESKEFSSAKSKISMGIGKNISGTPIVVDLKEMPHLLIAGSTGSGKSVCINSIIMSFLYKATPDEVKLILIDPKVVELSVYNGIPHLLIPVVTEPGKAAAALGWAVTEMDDRYKKFERESVRDLQSYNETVIANDEREKVLPQIVIIIDEMADLMAAAQNQIETYINRLAAKARAAGIHLIFATQHPSVNVISGTIKSNFPSRIALAVSSMMDSRVILDEGGAENLLGKGDMLYSPQNLPKPMRVQGCFVSDDEIEKVIEFVKKNSGVAQYSQAVNDALTKTGANSGSSDSGEEDDLYREAVEFVVSAEQASVSSLQRRFRIGYNRAARLIDDMEERGIVGPADGSHPRKVLMTQAEFEEACKPKGLDDQDVDF